MSLISLIGYRGTGKSTVAQLLACQVGWSWLDADVEIEQRAGKTIHEIFAAGGESEFRDLESSLVEELTQPQRNREGLIVAWGGGAILREKNREALRREKLHRGKVIWLTADPRTILDRVSADPTSLERRPNLTTAGGLKEIEELLTTREPLYRDCADLIVDTVGKPPAKVAEEIAHWLRTN